MSNILFLKIPDPHIECIYVIVAPVGESLRMDFVERFDLTPSPTCEDEYVELKDGSTTNARLIGTFCERAPPTQYTKGNVLRVKFFTQVSDPRNGFKAKISLAKCGGIRRSSSGFIASPKYPGLGAYPSNSNCDYKIIANFNSVFNISFIDMDLPPKEDSGNCSSTKDNIQIFSVMPSINDTSDDMLTEIGRYCGQNKISVVTQSNQVMIRFNSFAPNSIYRGFKLKFETGKLSCGSAGNIEAESGEISSPGYPNQVTLGYCEWKILVPKGRRVKIDFVDVDLMQSANRYLQRIAFYNDFQHLNRIKFLVNDSDRQSVYSTDNKMMVSFWVRYSSKNKGFKIRFSSDEPTVCLGDLNQREGTIAPPIGLNLTSFVCEYVRNGQPIGKNFETGTIALTFENVQFGRRVVMYNCRYVSTVIQVFRRSGDDDEKFLSRICTNQTKHTVVSPFPDISLLMKQSPFFGKLNFNLSYKTHECGGLLKGGGAQIIKNPIFGMSHYGPVDCAWKIEYLQEYKIHLKISKINFTLPCEQEYIKIYNGPSAMHPSLGKFCNGQTLDTLSTYKSVFVEFHSDSYGDGELLFKFLNFLML
jgi:cubilin